MVYGRVSALRSSYGFYTQCGFVDNVHLALGNQVFMFIWVKIKFLVKFTLTLSFMIRTKQQRVLHYLGIMKDLKVFLFLESA